LTPGVRNSAWMAVALVWGGSALVSHRRGRHHLAGPSPLSAEETYAEALDHYLKGNWFEAEHALAQVLRRNPRDLDAGLMLATLFRHTGRIDEAERQLQRLERLEGSQKWQFEIGRERELLHEAGASMTTVGGRSGDPPGA
jgi:thioredoxin-like negative regulator of GroEL